MSRSWAGQPELQALLFECTVIGKPQPAGSKRGFSQGGRVLIVDANKNAKPWQQEVAAAAMSEWHGEPLLGPLSLTLEFYLHRPKGQFGSGRNAGVVKDSAPKFPAVKPDTSKLVRGVEDALTGIIWRDDAQIVYQVAAKHYGLPERCKIRVYG